MPAVWLILLFCSIQYLFFFFYFFLCLLLRKHYWCFFFKHKNKTHMFLLLFELYSVHIIRKNHKSPCVDGLYARSLPGNPKSSCFSGQRCSDKCLNQMDPKRLCSTHQQHEEASLLSYHLAQGSVTFLHSAAEGSNTAHNSVYRGAEIPSQALSWQGDCHLFSSCLSLRRLHCLLCSFCFS